MKLLVLAQKSISTNNVNPMNQEGRKIVIDTLNKDARTMGATVLPEPTQGQEVRDVEFYRRGMTKEAIIAVLKKAGLMQMSLEPLDNPNAPKFTYTAGSPMPQKGESVWQFRDTKVN